MGGRGHTRVSKAVSECLIRCSLVHNEWSFYNT